MKKRILKLLLIAVILSNSVVFAQYGPSFTQYMFNEVFINPAYTGSQDALSLNGSYRNQWIGIEGAPVTQTFVAHTPLFNKKIGIGISAMNENISVYKKTGGYVNLAYRILFPKSTLSFGLLGGIQSIREDFTKIKTTQQMDEQFLYVSPRVISPNFGFGVYYYSPKYYAGISIPRFMQSKLSADSSKVMNTVNQRDFSYYLALGYVFNENENMQLKPSLMIKMLQGAPIQGDFALTALLKKVLWIGASYRTSQTLSGIAGFQFTPQFKLTYSYDYTFSDLRKYNSGSHEIQLSYIFSFNKEKIVTPRLF